MCKILYMFFYITLHIKILDGFTRLLYTLHYKTQLHIFFRIALYIIFYILKYCEGNIYIYTIISFLNKNFIF